MKFNAKRAREAGKRSGAARKQASVIVEGLANAAARVDLSVEALSAARILSTEFQLTPSGGLVFKKNKAVTALHMVCVYSVGHE